MVSLPLPPPHPQNEAKEALRAACGVRSLDELESALSQAAKASLPAGACPGSLLACGVRG